MELLYDAGEQIIVNKSDLKEYLDSIYNDIKENDNDEEYLDYILNENKWILEKANTIDGNYIGLEDCAMSGYYVINQGLVKDWLDGEI